MTWFTQSTNETEAAKSRVTMFMAADFDFSSGHVRVWTGWGDITLNGQTYTGIGTLGSVSDTPDQTRLMADKKTFRLSGTDNSLMSEADIDACFGRSVTQYFGFLDDSRALVATPEVLWEGRMDSVIRFDGAEPYIEVQSENRLVLLDQANGWRYTHEHQQQFFSGDDGLKLVPATMTAEVVWGGQKIAGGTSFTGDSLARYRKVVGG